MCYQDLYKEYLNEMNILKSYIKFLKKQSNSKSYSEQENIKYRISILYSMYVDMKYILDYLKKKCEVMKIEE